MELSFLSLLVILSFCIVALSMVIHREKPTHKINLPPGSFEWPFINETYEFLYANPEKFIGNRMKKYSEKIFKNKVFGEPTIVLCGAAGNKFIATNEEKLFQGWRPYSIQKLLRSTYETVSSASISRETEVHVVRAPGFLEPKALVRYLGSMDSTIQQHLKMYWEGKEKVKAYDLLQLMTVTLSSHFYLGLEVEDQARISKLAKLLDGISLGIHSMPINFPGTIFYRAKKSADAMRKELLFIIKEKKAAISRGIPMHDILTYMIMKTDPTGRFMPDHEIADKVMGLLVAGSTTPATALTSIMKFIGERPEIYDKIRAEQLEINKNSSKPLNWEDLRKMKYTWNVALEVMRLVPPFQGTFREATTDFTYEGFTIPKGWKIYWAVSTTNKNPGYFPEPEKFIPTRFEQENCPPPYTNSPFGGGPRVCPGKEYARLVLLTFLHNIVKTLKWEVIVPNEKTIGSMIPTPAQGLPVRLQPHFA